MKKLECRYHLFIAWIFGIEPWEYVGAHTKAFWKRRLKILRDKEIEEPFY